MYLCIDSFTPYITNQQFMMLSSPSFLNEAWCKTIVHFWPAGNKASSNKHSWIRKEQLSNKFICSEFGYIANISGEKVARVISVLHHSPLQTYLGGFVLLSWDFKDFLVIINKVADIQILCSKRWFLQCAWASSNTLSTLWNGIFQSVDRAVGCRLTSSQTLPVAPFIVQEVGVFFLRSQIHFACSPCLDMLYWNNAQLAWNVIMCMKHPCTLHTRKSNHREVVAPVANRTQSKHRKLHAKDGRMV